MITYRTVKDAPGYRVGDDGSVWSCRNNRWGLTDTWRILTPHLNKVTPGYTRQIIRMGRGRTRYVHHVVLEAFVGPRPPGSEACHRDGDATNNSLSNLYWGTKAENLRDKFGHQRHYNNKLSDNEIRAIRMERAKGVTQGQLATKYGVSQPTISAVVSGKRWAHVK